MEGACKTDASPADDKQKLSSLVTAAELGHVQDIKKLMKEGADVNAVDDNGYSPLIQATENNFMDIVSILLEAGADVNIVDKYGDTALIHATENGYDGCLKLLIDGGADVNVTDSDGDAAVSLAVLYGKDKCLKLLIGAGVDVNMVKTATTLNHDRLKEIEEEKQNYRALIPHTVPTGSLLHVAVYEGFDKCVNVLIEAGADVNEVPDSREPAVITAVRKGYPKCVAALVAAGADVNIKPKNILRPNAIECAICRSDPEIFKLLLTANVAENELTAALNSASSKHESRKLHKSLLESHLAAKRSEDTGSSSTSKHILLEENLQKATKKLKDSLECIELLQNYNTNKTDVMTVAAQNGLHFYVKSLVEGGVDVN